MVETSFSSLISVIIPTFNRAGHVTRAVESVLVQTYPNREIIVVDDGSTDNTREAMKGYENRIKYIYQDNAGVSAARNVGIQAASGQWIAFLDSDDIWLPNKLARQIRCVNRKAAKVCFTNYILSSGKESIQNMQTVYKRKAVEEKEYTDALELMLVEPVGLYVPTMLVVRDLLEQVGCFHENLVVAEDTHLIYELALRVPFAFIFQPLVLIDHSGEQKRLTNNSFQTRRVRNDAHISILSSVYFRYGGQNHKVITRLRHKLGYALSRRAEIACSDRDYPRARRLATDSLRFGGDWRTNLRSLAVRLCPQYVAKRYERVYIQQAEENTVQSKPCS